MVDAETAFEIPINVSHIRKLRIMLNNFWTGDTVSNVGPSFRNENWCVISKLPATYNYENSHRHGPQLVGNTVTSTICDRSEPFNHSVDLNFFAIVTSPKMEISLCDYRAEKKSVFTLSAKLACVGCSYVWIDLLLLNRERYASLFNRSSVSRKGRFGATNERSMIWRKFLTDTLTVPRRS